MPVAVIAFAATFLAGADAAEAAPVAGYGFVWANQPGAGSYTPSTLYQANSTGGVNTITRQGTGRYTIVMPGLGAGGFGGNVQATAYGGGSERCKVERWNSSGANLLIRVRCHSTAGGLHDSMFTAFYHHDKGLHPYQAGYVWANQPATPNYTPSLAYQANSKGGINTIMRTGVGRYRISFPGFTTVGGDVQVTAYGTSSHYCKVVNWGVSTVNVACYTPWGGHADTYFSALYTDKRAPGVPWKHAAYLWANEPGNNAWHSPSGTYSWNSRGANRVRRTGLGSYEAYLHGQPALNDTNTIVTAYGWDSSTCKVRHWVSWSNGTLVRVACHRPNGAPVDSRYTLLYTTNQS